jgi:predicted N-acetyltransferase YhbS
MEMTGTAMTAVEDNVMIRRATSSDIPAILELLEASLGWRADERHADFFAWKHVQNPFGPSTAWVAVDDDGQHLGFRTFLRWEFMHEAQVVRAVRAVDTATRPEVQRRGIFSRLTRTAIATLAEEQTAFVFNTPNRRSLPGYLRMGWQKVGRLPAGVRGASARGWTRVLGARSSAEKWSLHSLAGVPASTALSDRASVERLLASIHYTELFHTRRSAEYLQWRYGFPPLGYRILTAGATIEDGAVVFRLRRRAAAVQAMICDLLAPSDEPELRAELCRRVLTSTAADYAIRIGRPRSMGGFVAVPGGGPLLTWRALAETTMPALRQWQLSLGDVELF